MKPADITPGCYLRIGIGPNDKKPDIAAVLKRTDTAISIVFLDALWCTEGKTSQYNITEVRGRAVLNGCFYVGEFSQGNGEKIIEEMRLNSAYCADRSITEKEFGKICEDFLSNMAEAKSSETQLQND